MKRSIGSTYEALQFGGISKGGRACTWLIRNLALPRSTNGKMYLNLKRIIRQCQTLRQGDDVAESTFVYRVRGDRCRREFTENIEKVHTHVARNC